MVDDEPPTLMSYDLKPKITSPLYRSIGLIAHIVDDQSGLSIARAWYSPSGGQSINAIFLSQYRNFGTSLDGLYYKQYYSGRC